MNERPILMWLSYYRPGDRSAVPPRQAQHLGVVIVEAYDSVKARDIAIERGLAPVRGDGEPPIDIVTQGIGAPLAHLYRPHLYKLLSDEDLIAAFGADGVFMEDGKTTLGEAAGHGARVPTLTTPPPETIDTEFEDDFPIESPPFEGASRG
jgi:hypothetical protein